MKPQKDPFEESIRYHLDGFELPVSERVWEQVKAQAIHAPIPAPVQPHLFFRYSWKWVLAACSATMLIGCLLYFSFFTNPKSETNEPSGTWSLAEPNYGGCPLLPELFVKKQETGKEPICSAEQEEPQMNHKPMPSRFVMIPGFPPSSEAIGSKWNDAVSASYKLRTAAPRMYPALSSNASSKLPKGNHRVKQKKQDISGAEMPPAISGKQVKVRRPSATEPSEPGQNRNQAEIKEAGLAGISMLEPDLRQADSLPETLLIQTQKRDSLSAEFKKVSYQSYFKNILRRASWLIEAGPAISYRNISGTDPRLIDLRNRHESAMLAGNLFIGGEFTIHDTWIWSTGLGIVSKGESNHLPGHPSKTDTVYHGTYDPDCGCYYIKADISHLDANLPLNIQNRYLFLNLPVSLGYRLQLGNNWFLSPSLGLGFNFLLAATSSWIDPATDRVLTYTKSANGYKPLSFSVCGAAELGKKIGESLSIGFKPGYTRFLQSIYKDGYAQHLYPYSLDLSASLHYKF